MIENRSPALAWVIASLIVPQQYAEIMRTAITNVNAKCKSKTVEIDK